jgi:hypothetical protein
MVANVPEYLLLLTTGCRPIETECSYLQNFSSYLIGNVKVITVICTIYVIGI